MLVAKKSAGVALRGKNETRSKGEKSEESYSDFKTQKRHHRVGICGQTRGLMASKIFAKRFLPSAMRDKCSNW